MSDKNLGELQELVLLVIGNLKEDAYGLAIKEFITKDLDRHISISAIHATLQRLEKKSLVTSQYDSSSNTQRGGRPKLVFQLTALGEKTLAAQRDLRNTLWKGMSELSLSPDA